MGVLRPLFVSLPTPKDTDQESLIAGYFVALEGMELEALQSVVMKVVKGLWDDKVVFCPRPPELATMVRKEQRRLEEARQPKIIHSSVRVDFKDWRIIHRDKAEELRKKGYTLTAEGQEVKSRYSGVPAGSVFFWSTGEIWSPAQRTR